MMKPLLMALCALPLSACALFKSPQQSASAPVIERPEPTPVSLRAPKVDHRGKTQMRAASGPRAIIPCFDASPIANDCRWDGTLNEAAVRQDLQADAAQNKNAPIRTGN